MKTAIITPAYSRDRHLLDLACHYVDRFCPGEIDHIIVASRRKKSLFKHLESSNRKILFVEDIVQHHTWMTPYNYRKRELYFYNFHRPVDGWIMQQVIKFAAPDYCPADLFIYLDADVFLIKPFLVDFFVQDSKVRLLRKPPVEVASHLQWHRRARQLFQLSPDCADFPDYIGGLLSWRRDVVLALRKDLEQKWHRPWLDLMIREKNFSEYTLYGTYVDRVDAKASEKHFATSQDLCFSIWEMNPAADPADELRRGLGPQHIAVNIQSNIRLPFERYSDAVRDAITFAQSSEPARGV